MGCDGVLVGACAGVCAAPCDPDCEVFREVLAESEVWAIREPAIRKHKSEDPKTRKVTDVEAQLASEINTIDGLRLA